MGVQADFCQIHTHTIAQWNVIKVRAVIVIFF